VSLVLDGSMTVTWFFADEQSAGTRRVLDIVARTGAAVPNLWRLEVANAMLMAVRRGRIDAAYRDASLADLARLAIAVDPETDEQAWSATLQLSDRFGLTVYDAAYLELARRRRLPLATLDRALQEAADTLGIAVLGA
jgi:predicted nucleic acid-binding protein